MPNISEIQKTWRNNLNDLVNSETSPYLHEAFVSLQSVLILIHVGKVRDAMCVAGRSATLFLFQMLADKGIEVSTPQYFDNQLDYKLTGERPIMLAFRLVRSVGNRCSFSKDVIPISLCIETIAEAYFPALTNWCRKRNLDLDQLLGNETVTGIYGATTQSLENRKSGIVPTIRVFQKLQ